MTGRKIMFCAGGRKEPGWDCYDIDMDITKPLPIPGSSVSFSHIEHGIEHVTPSQAWQFLEECYRILNPKGVLRIAYPSIADIEQRLTSEYCEAVKRSGFGDGSRKDALKAVVCGHGHKSVWTQESLRPVLRAIGFDVRIESVGSSIHRELRNIEQHGMVVGEAVNRVETSVIEATKP